MVLLLLIMKGNCYNSIHMKFEAPKFKILFKSIDLNLFIFFFIVFVTYISLGK